jgi:hypothetical protein
MSNNDAPRIPPYLDIRPGLDHAIYPITVPHPGPAVVVIWPDAPSDDAVMRVARAVELALRTAWPPVARDEPR